MANDLDRLERLAMVGEACECSASVPTSELRALIAEVRAARDARPAEGASIAEALEALTHLEIVRRNDGYIPSSYHRIIRSALERAAREADARAVTPPPPRPIVDGSTWRWGYREDFRAKVLDNGGGFVTYQYLDPEKGTYTALEANFRQSMLHVSDPELNNEKE